MPPPSDDERALLRAICAQPEDDVPRLVYADWLEEQGRGVRGDYIRLQCHLAQALRDPEQHAYRSRLIDNLQDLINSHPQEEYHEELPEIDGVSWSQEWLRGFPATVTISFNTNTTLETIESLTQLAYPFDTINFTRVSFEITEYILESSLLSQASVVVIGTPNNMNCEIVTRIVRLLPRSRIALTRIRRVVVHCQMGIMSGEMLCRVISKSACRTVFDLRNAGGHIIRDHTRLREHFGDRILLPGD